MDQALSYLMAPSTMYGGAFMPQLPGLNLGGIIPGLGGAGGAAMGMLLQPLLMQFAQSHGFAGLNFMGQQNLFDTFQAQQLMMQRQQAVQYAAQADSQNQMQMMQGMMRLAGVPVTAERTASAQNLVNTFSPMMDIFSIMAPDVADRMMGTRGSARVMSQAMFRAGQLGYDPFDRGFGWTGETTGFIARRLHEDMFTSNRHLFEMRGLSSGQTGMMLEQMQRRGMLGGEDAISSAMSGLPTILGGAGGDAREAEVMRIRRTLEKMAPAVAAVKDILGDAGHPDAPMAQIFDALTNLTQGRLASMDPGRVAQLVRQTQILARNTGLGVGGMMQLTAQAAAVGDQYGLDRVFAIEAAQQAAAFGVHAPTQVGFGGFNRDELTVRDAALRQQATRSVTAAQLAAIVEMSNLAKGKAGYAGSDLEAAANAIAAGQTDFTNKAGNRVNLMSLGPGGIQNISNGLVSATDFNALMQNPLALDATIAASGGRIQQVARASQGLEIGGVITSLLSGAFRARGIDNPGDLGRRAAEALRDMPVPAGADLANPAQAAELVAARLGITDEATKEALRSGLMTSGSFLARSPVGAMTGVHNLAQFNQMFNMNTARALPGFQARIAGQASVMDLLSGLGRGGLARNLIDAVITSAAGGGDLMTVLAQSIGGGVSGEQVAQALGDTSNLNKVGGIVAKFHEAHRAGNVEAQQAALKELTAAIPGLSRQVDTLEGRFSPDALRREAQTTNLRRLIDRRRGTTNEADRAAVEEEIRRSSPGATSVGNLQSLLQSYEEAGQYSFFGGAIQQGILEQLTGNNARASTDKKGAVQLVEFKPGSTMKIEGTLDTGTNQVKGTARTV